MAHCQDDVQGDYWVIEDNWGWDHNSDDQIGGDDTDAAQRERDGEFGSHLVASDVGQNTVEIWQLESGGGWVHPVRRRCLCQACAQVFLDMMCCVPVYLSIFVVAYCEHASAAHGCNSCTAVLHFVWRTPCYAHCKSVLIGDCSVLGAWPCLCAAAIESEVAMPAWTHMHVHCCTPL